MRLICPKCGCGEGDCSWLDYELQEEIPDLIWDEWLRDPVYAAEVSRYDRIAQSGADVYAGHAATKPEFRAEVMAGLLGGGPFVEIGPGFGELLRATEGERWAVDQSLAMLEPLRGIPDVRLVRALADHLPFEGVPKIAADSVFQTVPDRERFLCEMYRALEPGGLLVFSVAYRWNYPRRPQQGFDVRHSGGRMLLLHYLEELNFHIEKWEWLSLEAERWMGGLDDADLIYIAARKR